MKYDEIVPLWELPVVSIPRGESGLCLDCDVVFWTRKLTCPRCGTDTWLPLGNILKEKTNDREVLSGSEQAVAVAVRVP